MSKVKSRYSEVMAQRGMGQSYENSLVDPELLQLRQEIALLDVRIQQLVLLSESDTVSEADVLEDVKNRFPRMTKEEQLRVTRYVMGYMPQNFVDYRTFGRLATLVDRYEVALLARRPRDADEALRQLFGQIREGRKESDIWNEIQDSIDRRRRLVESETKRMAMNEQLIPVDRVVMVLTQTIQSLRDAVMRYVADKETQEYILVEAQRSYERNVYGSDTGQGSDQQLVDIEGGG